MKEKKVRVFTSGSFDLFHIGHLNILEKSALLGDELIVGVSTDELIQHYKGIYTPRISFIFFGLLNVLGENGFFLHIFLNASIASSLVL